MKTLNPNDLGRKLLVEECQKISVNGYLRKAKDKLKKSLIACELEIQGMAIELTFSKTKFNGTRYWFKCPCCKKRVGVIFIHPINQKIGCRTCLNLEYKKRRYKGMVETQ